MRNVTLYAAVSLDGFLADEQGSVDWLDTIQDSTGNHFGYEEFLSSVDTVLLGGVTYRQITTELFPNRWPYTSKECFVFTRRTGDSDDNVTFVHEDPASFTAGLKECEGKTIWVCGGAEVINQINRAGLIDTYYLSIIPILLGGGTALFAPDNPRTMLYLSQCRHTDGVIQAIYNKEPKPAG